MTEKLLTELLDALGSCETEEEYNLLIDQLSEMMSADQLTEIRKETLRARARTFDIGGFRAYYEVKYGFACPPHMDKAIVKAFEAHEKGVPFIMLGSRGFWKTVTFLTFDEYLIGHFPAGTGIITGANDTNCGVMAKNIANTIEFHPEWKKIFPHVIPLEKSWSADGYWVIDSNFTREEWTEEKAGKIDPTFVGGGYASSKINGRHPDLFLHGDDLHDLDSWKSETERTQIRDTYIGQISKTMLYKSDKLVTWNFLLGVPFSKEDTLNHIIATGNCVVYIMPCMVKAEEGDPGAVFIDGVNPNNGKVYDDIRGWWILTSPSTFGVRSVIAKRAEGKFSFWQMYMMDITTGSLSGLVYHLYDHKRIDHNWIASGGADIATIRSDSDKKTRDKFSAVEGKMTPQRQIVVTSGVLAHMTQAEAEDHLKNVPAKHRNWRPGIVEGDGLGEQFYLSFIRRNPTSKWRMDKTKGVNKLYRQGNEMGPWLENASVMISDEDTPFLNDLREALEEFPNGNNDVRDALYWLCRAFPECLSIPVIRDKIPTPQEQQGNDPYKMDNVWSNI